MKTLQNNFTTLEQSKRLLELGVPKDSADCALRGKWMPINFVPIGETYSQFEKEIHDLETKRERKAGLFQTCIPCWSVGQLIWIYCKLTNSINITIPYQSGMLCEVLIRTIEHNKKQLDFSKLED